MKGQVCPCCKQYHEGTACKVKESYSNSAFIGVLCNNLTYEELEKAIRNGRTIERCMVDQYGNDVEWNPVIEVDKTWNASRYRIVT